MTAYMRHTYGKNYGDWIPEVKTLTANGTYTLNALNSATPEDVAYKIVPDASKNEYFMVEYRKAEGWDQPLPSSGLLAYRVTPGVGGNLGTSRRNSISFAAWTALQTLLSTVRQGVRRSVLKAI